jgi:diacylglycerol kinase family enzyme
VDATEHLLGMADRWEPRQVDLGMLNGRYFTFAAGMGLDASVVKRVDAHPALKARFGPFYFVESAIATFLSRYVVNPPKLTIEVDGAPPVRGVSAFVQNAGHYTYFNALAGVVLTRARPYDVPTVTFRALSGAARIAKHRGIAAFGGFQAAVVRSADGRPLPVQVDGDYVGEELEARFEVAPGALRVVA